MADKSKIFIVVPAFNEAKSIQNVIKDIRKHGYNNIIVVDDGSFDNTYEICKKEDVITLRHIINRGKGAATKTGLDAARILNAQIAVTMDADGQHFAKDIDNLISPILNSEVDVTIGNRMYKGSGMSKWKFIVNFFASLVTLIFFGVHAHDSQCGLRGYSEKSLEVIDPQSDRYEFESEVLREIVKYKLKYVEVPVSVQYTKYSQSRYNEIKEFQPQNLGNGLKMLINMIIKSIT